MKNYKSKKRKNYNNLHAHNFLQSIFSTYLYLISSIHAFKFNSHATSTITSTNSDQLLQQIFSSLSDSYNSVNRANPSLSSSILKNVKNSITAKSPILSQLDEIEILPQPDTINSPINHEFKSKHSNLKHLNKITLKQASQSSLHDISNSNSQITSNKYENTSSRKVKHNPVNSNNNFYRPKKYNQKSFGYICTAESETPFNIQDGLNQIGRDGITSNFANTG